MFHVAIITMSLFTSKVCYVCNLGIWFLLGSEDTVVALSVTGILKVWIVTSEISGTQVRQVRLGVTAVFPLMES